MIDPTRYSAPIVRVYEEIVDTLLTDLAKRFNVRVTGNTPSFAYDVELLAQLGAVRKEAVNTIAARVADNEPMIRLAIEQSMLDALENVEPSLAEAARKGLLKSATMPMQEGVAAQLEAYSRQAVSQLNLVNTVMLDGTLQAYRNGVYHLADALKKLEAAQGVLNAETGKVILGASTRQEAVRSAVKAMAKAGITGFVDHGGHKWSPEAYVSMDIKTTCSNAANQAVFTRNEQYGNDLIWVRTNTTARPGCAPWQGKVIAMGGQGRWVTDGSGHRVYAYPVGQTTYHQPDGIFGINCHHGPPNVFIPGLSNVRGTGTTDPKANAERYQMSQQRRRLEREVRMAKREAAMLEAAGDKEGFEEAAIRVRKRQQALKSFASQNELRLSSDRTFVFGYNRSVSQKAAGAARRAEKLQAALAKEPIRLLDGSISRLSAGTAVTDIETFAGKGSNRELRVKEFLVQNYGGKADEWRHYKGRGYVDMPEGAKKAVLHWFYEESIGVRELFVKGWSKKK